MALSTTTSRIVYSGNGSTTQFSFPYYYLAKSHVKAVLVLADGTEQAQSETTHYTITDPSESGGTVTMLTPPATGQKLVLYREVPLTQEFEPVEGGALPAIELEKAIDKAVMCVQQLQDLISRSIVLGPATLFSNLRIPDPESSKILGWNSLANALTNYTPGADAQQVFSALGLTLCTKATAAEMAAVFGGATPAVQALSSPGVSDAGKIIQVNASGSGIQFVNSVGKNLIINGGLRVWQRGVIKSGLTAGSAYLADRFNTAVAGAVVVTVGKSENFPTVAELSEKGFASLLIQVTTADASIAAGDFCVITHGIEGYEFSKMIGNYITLSFWVRSPKTGVHCLAFRTGSPIDRSYVVEYTVDQVLTWEKKTITIQIPSSPTGSPNYTNGLGMQLVWAMSCGSTFQTTAGAWNVGNFFATSNQVNCTDAASEFRITGFKLNLGQIPTNLEVISFAEELELCRRFFQKTYDIDTAPGAAVTPGSMVLYSTGNPSSAYSMYLNWPFQVAMRMAPTVVCYRPSTGAINQVGMMSGGITPSIVSVGQTGVTILATDPVATTDRLIQAQMTADAEL